MEEAAVAPVAPEQAQEPVQQVEQTMTEQAAEQGGEKPEGEGAKPEKTPEQRRIARLEQQLHRRTVALARARERLELTPQVHQDNNQAPAVDSDTLSLRRSDAEQLIRQRAEELAPKIAQEQADRERLHSAATTLRKSLGAERFEELTGDLAEIFDRNRQIAVLRTANPGGVLSYLVDPDNSEEAESIASMSDFDAGRAIARIEAKVGDKPQKPKPYLATKPLSQVRGSAPESNGPSDSDSIETWVKKERARLASRQRA